MDQQWMECQQQPVGQQCQQPLVSSNGWGAAPAAMGGAAAPAAMGGAVAMGGTEAMGGRTTGNDFETWKSDVLHAGTEAAKATWLYICCYEQCSLHIQC